MTVAKPSAIEVHLTAGMARVEGRLETLASEMTASVRLITEQMRAGDETGKQLIELLRQAMAFHAADLGKLDSVVRENGIRSEDGLTAVRQDVEGQIGVNRGRIDVLEGQVVSLRMSWAKATGIALGAGVFASAATTAAVRAAGL